MTRLVPLSQILKLGYHRNIYSNFAKKHANIRFKRARDNERQCYYSLICHYEALVIWEVCINKCDKYSDIYDICKQVYNFFEKNLKSP